ncbi:MAG: type II toxin-antitoxin system RelE/ParE family toxin [Patescibacteria group bacterium]
MNIIFFDDKLEPFFTSLEKSTIAKVLRTIDLLEKFGNRLGMPHSKPIKGELFELRIRGIQEVRVIYAYHRGQIVLLHGFLKKTNEISLKDLNQAKMKKKQLDDK